MSFLQIFLSTGWSIFAVVGAAPIEPVSTAIRAELAPVSTPVGSTPVIRCAIAPPVLDELWRTCEAEACGLTHPEFEQIVMRIGMAQNFGLASGVAAEATPDQQTAFFAGLRMADLVLARACAGGNERAWERFVALHRQPLLRAGVAIANNESLGRELADGLYAELYGLTEREGERRCPLDSYSGRGSLIGWLRTTLAQRHVDHHRRTHREQPLDEGHEPPAASPANLDSIANATSDGHAQAGQASLPLLVHAVEKALERQGPEERFLLASYYLDGRRLHEIAAILGVHEATVSRKLKRATAAARKQIVRALERQGMSRRAAEEALATDPRDLTGALTESDEWSARGTAPRHLRLKELLQKSQVDTFKEQADR